MKRLKLTKNTEIGGYKLPADFPYITSEFLSILVDLSYEDRVDRIIKEFTGASLPDNSFKNIENAEFPSSVVTLDDSLAVLELFDGSNLNYNDYIFTESKELELLSLAAVIISAYVDLFSGGVIAQGEKINYAIPGDDGRLILATYLAKLVGLPIGTIIVGTDKPVSDFVNGLYFASPMGSEIDEIIEGLFEETDYAIEPFSAIGLLAEDSYYAEYDDGNLTVILAVASPFLSARRILKDISGINEISVDKAIFKLSMETALEIPGEISSKQVSPFFMISAPISAKDAIEIIKGSY